MCLRVCESQLLKVGSENTHVTLDKGKMRLNDWLFSDVMDCEVF